MDHFSSMNHLREEIRAILASFGEARVRHALHLEMGFPAAIVPETKSKTESEAEPEAETRTETPTQEAIESTRNRLWTILENASLDDPAAVDSYLDSLASDEDYEIDFLKKMIDYHGRENVYPNASSDDMKDFSRDMIGLNISTSQLTQIITLLNHKYKARIIRFRSYSQLMQPGDLEAFLCGEKIWGSSLAGHEENSSRNLEEEVADDDSQVVELFPEGVIKDVEDEVRFMKDMIIYYFINKVLPSHTPEHSNDFLKNWIGLDLSCSQLKELIKSIKRKYSAGKAQEGSLKSNELEPFILADKIWGSGIETLVNGLKIHSDEKREEGLIEGEDQGLTASSELTESLETETEIDMKLEVLRMEEIQLSKRKLNMILELVKAAV